MLKKKLTALITLLMLNSSVAYALPINYELYTNNTRKSYSIAELQESFLNSKTGQDHKIYDSFIRDLSKGDFIAIKDDSGKYVDYSTIIEAFLKVKNEGKTFDLNEFIKNANGFNIDGKYGKLDDYVHEEKITEKKDEVKKEEIKSETDEAIHYTREMIWNVMKSLAPNKLLPEGDVFIDKYYQWEDDISKTRPLDSQYYTLSTIKKLIAKKPEYNQKRQNKKEAEIFDLNNFMKFKGLSVKFDGLQNVEEHMDLSEVNICEPKSTTSEKEFRDILHVKSSPSCKLINNIDGYDATKYIYQCSWLNMAIWRPDIEKEIVQAINELRQSKGLKPLEYNVDLHAMGRYSAKRNNFEISYSRNAGADYGRGNLNQWLNKGLVGAESHCNPNCSDRHDYYSSYSEARGQAYRNKQLYKLMDKNSGKLFGYDKEVGYFAFADNTGLTGKGLIQKLVTQVNAGHWTMTGMEELQYLDQTPNLKEHILNPEMTKIGVGSIWNVPAGSIDENGNTGVVIFTSK
ncbi:hypothetical protein [Clostridium haemolyticum]|uniref:Uncharacterized protein n=1 Tax=Clostridium haemolyticum NCTC 9693 TaxID=1443114 RepID=A0ABR4TAT2_CLOHA|nr:hypothetical protein [Clostridium haemolyticum]KEI14051.1 hypothetical protein Z960_p0050 [Clostridium haemolyticum NCTC 9693]